MGGEGGPGRVTLPGAGLRHPRSRQLSWAVFPPERVPFPGWEQPRGHTCAWNLGRGRSRPERGGWSRALTAVSPPPGARTGARARSLSRNRMFWCVWELVQPASVESSSWQGRGGGGKGGGETCRWPPGIPRSHPRRQGVIWWRTHQIQLTSRSCCVTLEQFLNLSEPPASSL